MIKELLDDLKQLKPIHFNTLKFNIDFFREVTTYCDYNLMNTYNIAVTVGPNIFRSKDHKSEDILSSTVFTRVLLIMMKEFGYLFEDESRVADQDIAHGKVGSIGNQYQEILGETRTQTFSELLENDTV